MVAVLCEGTLVVLKAAHVTSCFVEICKIEWKDTTRKDSPRCVSSSISQSVILLLIRKCTVVSHCISGGVARAVYRANSQSNHRSIHFTTKIK